MNKCSGAKYKYSTNDKLFKCKVEKAKMFVLKCRVRVKVQLCRYWKKNTVMKCLYVPPHL